jgi:hypothetical protein
LTSVLSATATALALRAGTGVTPSPACAARSSPSPPAAPAGGRRLRVAPLPLIRPDPTRPGPGPARPRPRPGPAAARARRAGLGGSGASGLSLVFTCLNFSLPPHRIAIRLRAAAAAGGPGGQPYRPGSNRDGRPESRPRSAARPGPSARRHRHSESRLTDTAGPLLVLRGSRLTVLALDLPAGSTAAHRAT